MFSSKNGKQCEDFLPFFVKYDKLNIFGLWTAGLTKQGIFKLKDLNFVFLD